MSADIITMTGVVEEVLNGGFFKVKITDVDQYVLCYKNGRMRVNDIKVLLGDAVVIEVSHYDLSKGRIVRRSKKA